MWRPARIAVAAAAIAVAAVTGIALFYHFSDSRKLLLPVRTQRIFLPGRESLPPLRVAGNRILLDRRTPVLFHGVSIPDPSYLDNRNLFRQPLFERIAGLGADVVRVAVRPDQWNTIHDYLDRYLAKAARWAEQNRLYLIIDWQATGNLDTGDLSETTGIDLKQATFAFWDRVSTYFRNAPGVIFEIYGEPSGIDAADWWVYARDLSATIRANAPNQLILVDGIGHGSDLSSFAGRPVPGGNIAYAVHVLPDVAAGGGPGKEWARRFGTLSRTRPVLVSAWGYMEDAPRSDSYLAADRESFGEPLMGYLAAHGIGWIAGWFDDRWKPAMLAPDRRPNGFGSFVAGLLVDFGTTRP